MCIRPIVNVRMMISTLTIHSEGIVKCMTTNGLLEFWEIGCCPEGYVVIVKGKLHQHEHILHRYDEDELITCIFCGQPTNCYIMQHLEKCEKCQEDLMPFMTHECNIKKIGLNKWL